ncbi:MAG: UTP--glucose-1-phosphate uridylyltransferase [Chlamydiota bacterium]
MRPYSEVFFPQPHWESMGTKRMQEGKVVSVILAGGSASRLGIDYPKALFSFEGNRSLLEILCGKVAKQDISLPLYVLCSKKGEKELVDYAKARGDFGLTSLAFFSQKEILHPSGERSSGGNGALYATLADRNILSLWKEQGVEEVMVIPIDNPLAAPFDPTLIGMRREQGLDVSLIGIENRGEESTMGALAQTNEGLRILEYYENLGSFHPKYCNANQFCFSLPFLEKASKLSLPLHEVKRSGKIKTEELLFDAFVVSKKTGVLIYDKHLCYAPLKERTGDRGILSVETALKNQGIL